MSLGTNIAIMDHGLIQQCDTPKNIYNKPESIFVADFIGSPSMNLVEGKLIKDNDDIIFMPSGSNNNVKIPVGNYSFKNKFDGTEISAYLGIRPEHVYFEKINPDCFEINLKSELLEYTGHEQIVTFDYFGQQVLGKFASTFDIEINKNLKLNIDTSQISLFDKDSKKRI
jgi:multiple sugar transport system ATP-binding protein